jgi:hypothetical protein
VSRLRQVLADYLAVRRALGYTLALRVPKILTRSFPEILATCR